MGTERQYDDEFKKQAVKLTKEIGNKAAAEELGMPQGTLGTWLRKARSGEIDTGSGTRTSEESLNLAQQLQAANKRIKELEKKNRELEVSRAAFYGYVNRKDKPWKYAPLAKERSKRDKY